MIRLEAQQTMFVPTRKMSPRMDFESLYNALSPLNKIPITQVSMLYEKINNLIHLLIRDIRGYTVT